MFDGEKYVPRLVISIVARCDKDHETILDGGSISVDGGGCYGHGENEYCYCDSPKAIVEWDCMQCSKKGKRQLVEIS